MNFFFFNDTATTEIYTLSLHDALPILEHDGRALARRATDPHRAADAFGALKHAAQSHAVAERFLRHRARVEALAVIAHAQDRKSTRLNSSHANISYAVFCLKKNNSFTF